MTPYTSLPARRQNSFWRTIGMLLLWWMLSFSFSTSLQAQDGDFYQYLSESNSVNEFLKPQLSGRIMPFAGNETINKNVWIRRSPTKTIRELLLRRGISV
jgi:hypothetical protein